MVKIEVNDVDVGFVVGVITTLVISGLIHILYRVFTI